MDKKVFWYIHVFPSLYLSEVFERQGPLFSLQSEASIAARCFFIEIASLKCFQKSLFTQVYSYATESLSSPNPSKQVESEK